MKFLVAFFRFSTFFVKKVENMLKKQLSFDIIHGSKSEGRDNDGN